METGVSIFFSWQSDTDEDGGNRRFIRECLESAAKATQSSFPIEDAVRVEAGVEGLAGTPEIAAAIFDKIAASAVFVADVTLVASSDKSKKRRQPNSNVSIEMGFAAAVLGWDRVVCVMNETFGNRHALPFDHKNRRFPITYSSKDPQEKSRLELTEALTNALVVAERSELKKVERSIKRLDVNALRLIADFGREDHFSDPTGLQNAVDHHCRGTFSAGIPRLLDLGLIFADAQPANHLYAYHWTYLGKKVVQRLNFPKVDPAVLFT